MGGPCVLFNSSLGVDMDFERWLADLAEELYLEACELGVTDAEMEAWIDRKLEAGYEAFMDGDDPPF